MSGEPKQHELNNQMEVLMETKFKVPKLAPKLERLHKAITALWGAKMNMSKMEQPEFKDAFVKTAERQKARIRGIINE